jgi:hypothetical protein
MRQTIERRIMLGYATCGIMATNFVDGPRTHR